MKQASYQQIQDEQGYLILAFWPPPPPIGAVVPRFRWACQKGAMVEDIPTVVIGYATAAEWLQQRDQYGPWSLIPDNLKYLSFAKVVAE